MFRLKLGFRTKSWFFLNPHVEQSSTYNHSKLRCRLSDEFRNFQNDLLNKSLFIGLRTDYHRQLLFCRLIVVIFLASDLKSNIRNNTFEVDDEPVGDGIQQSNYIKIDDLSKNSLIDVQVALSLQSNQENEKRETDFVVVQTPFSKFIEFLVRN